MTKIAFITAIYGAYEQTCKQFVKQTIPCDFICFTDNAHIQTNGWIIDTTPYHYEYKSPLDDDSYINSLKNNSHTFNIAKYYKQNFSNIPRLQVYDIIVWLDGTIQITNKICAQWVRDKVEKKFSIISLEHTDRLGKLINEVHASNFHRYTSTHWFGQTQPFQDVAKQYHTYLEDGYNDNDYWSQLNPDRKNLGVWVTCFVVFDVRLAKIKHFLDLWYLQTLKHTTQDQVSFSYVVQKTGILPYTIPDHEITGDLNNSLFSKWNHGT